MNRIYYDCEVATPLDEEVIQEMMPYLKEKWGLSLQPHFEGQRLIKDQQKAYEAILDAIGATFSETFVFTSSRAEAISHVFDHVYRQVVRETGRNHFITLSSEEAPTLRGLERLESLGGHTTYLPANFTGQVEVQAIIDAITPRTAMITLSLANGLTGVLQSIQEIGEVAALRDIVFHLDISHALGKVDLDFQKLGAHCVTFGGELLHGPRSSGALIAKKSMKLTPFILGGLEQNGLRGGCLDTASLIGLATACRLMKNHLSEMSLEGVRLRDLFEKGLKNELKDITILFQNHLRLPNVSVISFEKVHADYLLYTLDRRGLSACMGGGSFQKLSHLLETMGFSPKFAHTALSFSFSRQTTLKEIQQGVSIIVEEVKRLRLSSQRLETADV